MNIDCEKIRDKLVDCISDHIEPKEDTTLIEHLRQCSACSKYYDELKADDQALSDFASSMQPILSRIETNVSKELETAKTRTIFPSKNKILRLAVAAVILIAVTLALNQFGIVFDGTSTAWAKVSQIILTIRTTTFDAVIGNGPIVSCTASERKLKQKLPNGVEAIFDYDKSKILLLNPNDKTAMTIELSSLPIIPANLFKNLKSTIETRLATHIGKPVQSIIRNMDDIKVIVDRMRNSLSPEDFHDYIFFTSDPSIYSEIEKMHATVPFTSGKRLERGDGYFIWTISKGNTLNEFGKKVLGSKKYQDKLPSRNYNTIQKVFSAMGGIAP